MLIVVFRGLFGCGLFPLRAGLERSEQMKSCYESQADYRGGETKEGLLNVNEPIESAAKSAKGVQPRIGSLDGPTSLSQTAAVLGVTLGNDRRNSQPTQDGSQWFGIIAAVALKAIWMFTFGSWFAANRRYRCQNMEGFGDLIDVGCRDGDIQRDALSIRQDMVFAARFAAIRGIWARFFTSFGCFGEGGVDQGAFPIDLVGAIEFSQNEGVQF
jgi:hypothetical protein